jgi:cardiolipin synthase (CMP-forming)
VNLNLPNLLSILRMGLIPLFVIAVLDGRPGRALLVFAIAGITDALDGAIARFWKQQTALGAYLDPAADKLLLVTAYVVLAIPNLHAGMVIPAWVTALVITRDVVIVVVALILYVAGGINRFPPTWISKVNTATQVSAVILVLLSGVVTGFEIAATVAVYAVAGLTLLSGIDYIRHASRMSTPR